MFDEFNVEPVEVIDAGGDEIIAVLQGNSGRAKFERRLRLI